jgi:predicted GTPase
VFISAEHGDGLQTLYQRIESLVPPSKFEQYENRKQKRIDRYFEYKNMLLDEIVDLKKEEINNALGLDSDSPLPEDAEEYEEDLA